MGAGTKDRMSLIIAARGTEHWKAGECGSTRGGVGGGPLVCIAEPLAVTVNKLRERKTVDQKKHIRTTTSDEETERKKQ